MEKLINKYKGLVWIYLHQNEWHRMTNLFNAGYSLGKVDEECSWWWEKLPYFDINNIDKDFYKKMMRLCDLVVPNYILVDPISTAQYDWIHFEEMLYQYKRCSDTILWILSKFKKFRDYELE